MSNHRQKIYAGTQLRELRQKLQLTQMEFAKKLDVSVSYLNQMENNNRPIAAAIVLSLAREFQYDISSLSVGDTTRLVADMEEAMADPIFGGQASRADLNLVAGNAPVFARAFLDLHKAYRYSQERMVSFEQALGTTAGDPNPQPWEEVRDFFHYCDNYIDPIDRAAENLASKVEQSEPKRREFAEILAQNGITVKRHVGGAVRIYDEKERVLSLSSSVEAPTQLFQMAVQIALLKYEDLIQASMDLANFQAPKSREIAKIGLANYFAGALIMPYERFWEAAREMRHDLEALAHHFEASIEQVAHRLSTLQRPQKKGVPFFFVRVDQAGTITKRHSATRLQFARFGGACPLWNVHRAFETPNDYLRQLAQTPDGQKYFCLARDVSKSGGSFQAPVRRFAIGLGCEIEHIEHIIYADDLDAKNPAAFEPIGVSCRICSRQNCHQRAVPPMGGEINIDSDVREVLPYRLS